jgi:hypothetical protein
MKPSSRRMYKEHDHLLRTTNNISIRMYKKQKVYEIIKQEDVQGTWSPIENK